MVGCLIEIKSVPILVKILVVRLLERTSAVLVKLLCPRACGFVTHSCLFSEPLVKQCGV